MTRLGPPRFARSPNVVTAVDAIARRYGVPPAEVLRWDPYDMTIAMICLQVAENNRAERLAQHNRAGGMVFPVMDIGGG